MSWKAWVMIVVAILIVGPVGYGIFLEQRYLPYVGISWLALLGVTPGFLVVVGLVWLLKFILRVEWKDVGEFGTIGQLFHHLKEYSPRAAVAPSTEKEKEKLPTIVIPPVSELLKDGLLGTLDLLLGFTLDGRPYWGSWSRINTFCVAGKSRSGKTITLFFLIIQAVLNGAVVFVCDPHANRKKSALIKLLEPLAQWIRFAVDPKDIASLADEFYDTMQARIDNINQDETPYLFVCDEFNGAAEDNPRLYEIVNKCAREWAGVNGFAAIAGHEWTASGKGKALLVTMRRNLHAKFVHRLDAGYAKFLLNSGKYAKATEKLKTGYNFFQDVEGEIIELRTPLGTKDDAITIASKLLQLAGPEYKPEIAEHAEHAETDRFKSEIIRFIRAEISDFKRETPQLPEKTEVEISDFKLPEYDLTTYEGRKAKVTELRKNGFIKQGEIIYLVWNEKPGETQGYKNARAEYQKIVEEIARGVTIP